jgi:hypothetical protein
MHTANMLDIKMFDMILSGRAVSDSCWLDWGDRDRLGIIIRSPAGALGAALLAMVSITAFYDRPGKDRRRRPIYPELYLFHVGGKWGCFGSFDFWPERREVFLPDEPSSILQALNTVGITHLALPERPAGRSHFRYREAETAIDRIKQCYLYDAQGCVTGSDVLIGASDPVVFQMYEDVLFPEATAARLRQTIANDASRPAGTPAGDDLRIGLSTLESRVAELRSNDLFVIRMRERLAVARGAGRIREELRALATPVALDLLA